MAGTEGVAAACGDEGDAATDEDSACGGAHVWRSDAVAWATGKLEQAAVKTGDLTLGADVSAALDGAWATGELGRTTAKTGEVAATVAEWRKALWCVAGVREGVGLKLADGTVALDACSAGLTMGSARLTLTLRGAGDERGGTDTSAALSGGTGNLTDVCEC